MYHLKSLVLSGLNSNPHLSCSVLAAKFSDRLLYLQNGKLAIDQFAIDLSALQQQIREFEDRCLNGNNRSRKPLLLPKPRLKKVGVL